MSQQQQYVQDPETKHLREEILASMRPPEKIAINGEKFHQKFKVEGATNCAEALSLYQRQNQQVTAVDLQLHEKGILMDIPVDCCAELPLGNLLLTVVNPRARLGREGAF